RRGRRRPRGDPLSHERVVLARRTSGFVPFQWTGAEPDGLDDVKVATALGARWEDDELVIYDLDAFRHEVASFDEDYMSDND
ncbi:MAG: hypothetical protein ACRDYA_15910, partial [Egibacteraceae bacterium]